MSELSRGWMSISGIINTHFIVVNMLMRDGTDEQKQRFLPRMATGEIRGAFSMTEPECGSDVQAIRSSAVRDGDDYIVNGQKMWVTNGLRSGVVALLVKTDTEIKPAHKGMSCLLVEKTPGVSQEGGLTIPPQLRSSATRALRRPSWCSPTIACPPPTCSAAKRARASPR